MPAPDESSSNILEVLEQFGADAIAFQALESGLRWWRDQPPPHGTGAALAYAEVGRSWIAIGTPLTAPTTRAEAAQRFARAARAARRRPVFFGVERLEPFDGFRRLMLGLQSEVRPSEWPATLGRSAKLREQVRRARAKGVTVRIVPAAELVDGAPLRTEVERLAREWLGSRPMEPMGFLVAVEPFHAAAAHRYVLAEHRGRAVQFLSAVPIYGRRGWLLEDMLRGPAAPNGTSELIIDRFMRESVRDAEWATHGLTPLAGAVPWWLHVVRMATTPLYDFRGLQRFRARLLPPRWSPVWLVWDRGPAALVLLDVLRAFAGGRLLPFAWRTLVRHPNGPPWAVAVPLVVWTLLLAVLATTGRASLLGFSSAQLAAWVVFDTVLASLLFRAAKHPRPQTLVPLMVAAGFDAVYSIRHLAAVGLGESVWSAILRLLATAGPVLGTIGLAWAWRLAVAVRAARHPRVASRG